MIAIGSDHGGYELKNEIINAFPSIDFKDYGCYAKDPIDYPDIAFALAEDVASGTCERGILICRSGIGMDMAANKVSGVRCALCFTPKMAEMARKHEDANVIAIGADYITKEDATKVVKAWLEAEFEGERHKRRIDKIKFDEDKMRK